jgi:hypothetical protein
MGRSNTSNPPLTVSPADEIFFPQRPQLHLGERQYSPDFQHKLTETAARVKSFEQAAALGELWSDQPIAPRTVARIAEQVGQELVAQRDAAVGDFTHHRRRPEGVDPKHDLAVIFVDGGRVQVRDEDAGPGVHNERWQEDKIARLQTMTTDTYSADPCPELPACFLRPILAGVTPPPILPDISQECEPFLHAPPPEPALRWQPKPAKRTCVGTMQPLDEFRWMVQAEAKRRHFFTATRKAFVADGSHGNWTLWARHFPEFVPILDFMHAAEYLHAAAKAIDAATRGVEWARDLWQGRSGCVIASLLAILDQRGIGEETLDEKHPLFALQRAWVYLSNASDKLDYPRYRREGLPTTSSLIESQIKEFNARLKGSEKFWYEANAEGMLELVSWALREDGQKLADYFETRPTSPFRRGTPKTLAS